MKKVLLVFGTRPEAIKMAPLVQEFRKYPMQFETRVCVTGQHRELLDQVLELFHITTDYDLNIMKLKQDLFDITSCVLLGMRDVLKEAKPDLVLVHGDTTTSMAAALAAFYQRIPVGHVEAGLRTGNKYSPWPEEMNRSITSRIATYNFAPTLCSKDNLLKENVAEESIFVTGNTVIDALQRMVNKLNMDLLLVEKIRQEISEIGYDVDRLASGRRMILVTGHRRENFGEGFLNICHAIRSLAGKYPLVDFVYPMHLNPNVRKPVLEVVGNGNPNVFLIEPLQYLQFVFLMQKSYLVLTDSGGVQEEAPGLGKPVLVMRDTTERCEAVESGTVMLVGADSNRIERAVSSLLDDSSFYERMSKAVNPYGDGKACGRIVEYLMQL